MAAIMLLLFCLALLASVVPVGRCANLSEVAVNATYDFVVVGCGVSGLVVAMRLSELTNSSVVCVEAGPLDHYEEIVQFPVYIGRDIGGIYDWNLSTTPQTQLDGGTRPLPLGKVVGGGSILNGMVWNRGNQDDYNAWVSLGNPGWSWNDLLPYFKKSETFTPRYYEGRENQPVHFHANAHGFSGPVQVSYSQYYWNQSDNFFDALNELGVPTVFDDNEGLSAGACFLPADIDPINQTRSDARRAYYDPYSARTNFDVLTNSQVTKILFDQGGSEGQRSGARKVKRQSSSATLHATGVEYASGPQTPRQTIFARREVVVASGALHSPQLMQLSGFGPAAKLQAYGIPVLGNLPGVGNNLQDHCLVNVDYEYLNPTLLTPIEFGANASYNAASESQYLSSKSGPWTAEPSAALGFPSLTQITNDTPSMIEAARNGGRYYPAGYDSTLQAGYERQFNSTLNLLSQNNIPAYENLNNNGGGLTVSLMHPLSRGTVQIVSADPFTSPSVDPRWLANPLDMQVMIAAMQFNQLIINTPPIQALQPCYNHFPQNPTIEQLTSIINGGIRTEFHYSGTCAMMPRELGGVVDPDLLVYGTDNLRIVDTSIFPLVPGAHLQAVAYAVAEKAADLIKSANNATNPTVGQEPQPAHLNPGYMVWLLSFLHLNVTQ